MQKPLFPVKLCWWYRQRSPICFAEDLFCAFTDSLIFSPLWHNDIVPHLLLLLFAWLCFYSKRCICYEHRKHCKPLKICWCFTELSTWAIDILIFYLNISCWIFHDLLCNSLLQCIPALLWLMLVEGMFVHSHMVKNVSHGVKGHHSNCTLACCKVSIEREIQEIVFLSFSLGCYYHTMIKKKKCKNGGRDYNLYIKAENENRGRQTRRLEKQEDKDRNGVEFGWHGRHRPTDTTSAVASRLRTLFAEFGEEAEACDGWPGEDDGVLARDVLAELLGHKAVELRLVLQGGQTICTLTVLQVDWDLSSARTENTYIKQI